MSSPPKIRPTYSSSDNQKVTVKDTHKYGLGVFAIQDIKKGELIASFDGEVHEGYFQDDLPHHVRDYGMQFELNKVRDSNGIARFINHSCNPNCGVSGLFDIVAMHDIAKDEELTWDYDMSDDSEWILNCNCGHEKCRKQLRGFRYLPIEFRQKYEGYISDWLKDTNQNPPLPFPENS